MAGNDLISATASGVQPMLEVQPPQLRRDWEHAFTTAYRKLRPSIGRNHAKLHAKQAYQAFQGLMPERAAKLWFDGDRPGYRTTSIEKNTGMTENDGYQIIKVGRCRRKRFTAAVVVSGVSEPTGRPTTTAAKRCLSAMQRGLAGQLFLVDVPEIGAVEREVATNVYARQFDRVVFLCASEEIAAAVASKLLAFQLP